MVIKNLGALLEAVRALRAEGCTHMRFGTIELGFYAAPATLAEQTGFPDAEEFMDAAKPMRSVMDDPGLYDGAGVPTLRDLTDES